jgi:hypothetical protein
VKMVRGKKEGRRMKERRMKVIWKKEGRKTKGIRREEV